MRDLSYWTEDMPRALRIYFHSALAGVDEKPLASMRGYITPAITLWSSADHGGFRLVLLPPRDCLAIQATLSQSRHS